MEMNDARQFAFRRGLPTWMVIVFILMGISVVVVPIDTSYAVNAKVHGNK